MKKLLLIGFMAMAISLNAQTTYTISWAIGSNGEAASLTIDVGDTVTWEWDDTAPHTVTNKSGSAETFDSGQKTGIDETYSYTFTVEGDNPYQCDVHPGTMFGTITVDTVLGLEDNVPEGFKLISNVTTDILTIILPSQFNNGDLKIYDLTGKEVLKDQYRENDEINMNISFLNDGVYILKMNSNGLDFAKRFIKQ